MNFYLILKIEMFLKKLRNNIIMKHKNLIN
jgi:hypothetical protein